SSADQRSPVSRTSVIVPSGEDSTILATASGLSRSAGNAGSSTYLSVVAVGWLRTAETAPTVVTTVIAAGPKTTVGGMAASPDPSRRRMGRTRGPKPLQPGQARSDQRDQHRHGPDVERLAPGGQVLDVLAQGVLHGAQLPAQIEHLGAEVVDLLLLGRGEDHAALLLLLLERADLGLGVLDPGEQLLLLGPEPVLGVLLHGPDHLEWPVDQAAAAQADQSLAAGEVVERVDREAAVVGDRDRDLLPEQVLLAHPGRIGEQVGVRDQDQLQRRARLGEMLRLGGHAIGRTVGKRALDPFAGDAR